MVHIRPQRLLAKFRAESVRLASSRIGQVSLKQVSDSFVLLFVCVFCGIVVERFEVACLQVRETVAQLQIKGRCPHNRPLALALKRLPPQFP